MDDVYYATKDFGLLDADLFVRGRARWDTDTQIRRLLVAVKGNTTVDESGLKHAAKVDVRTDSATAEDIANLDRDVRVGSSRWSGPLSPLKGVYDTLNEKGVLPDIGGRTGVLMLEPKVHIRSVRNRYRLNESLPDPRSSKTPGCRRSTPSARHSELRATVTSVRGRLEGRRRRRGRVERLRGFAWGPDRRRSRV